MAGIIGIPGWYEKLGKLPPLTENWYVPTRFKIEGDNLYWRDATDMVDGVMRADFAFRVSPDRKTLREKILFGFTRLANASNEEILDYARQWGILGICVHNRPTTHEKGKTVGVLSFYHGCDFAQDGDWYYEPLQVWRDYAQQFRAILSLVAALRKENPPEEDPDKPRRNTREKIGSRENWEIVFRECRKDAQNNPTLGADNFAGFTPISGGWMALEFVINNWIFLTNIQPKFWWWDGRSGVSLGNSLNGWGLLPILVVQMLLEANNTIDLALCSGCNQPFLLRRGQSVRRNSYCDDCRAKAVPQKEALKRYQNKKRDGQQTSERVFLTERQAGAIRQAFERPKRGLAKQLAEKYGVSIWAIYKIKEGKNWKPSGK